MNQDPGNRSHSFSAGFGWLTEAMLLVRNNATRLLLLGLLLQMLGGASQVGVLGVLFLLAAPALTAGMLQGMHLAAGGGKPSALTLFAAFQGSGRLLPLFLLGGLTLMLSFVVVSFVMVGGVANMDPETLARIQSGDQAAVAELDPALLQRILVAMVAGLGLGLVLSFFAIPLIWFQGRPLSSALVTAIRTMFREFRALSALGIGLFFLGVPVGLVAAFTVSAQLSSNKPSMILTVIMLLLVVIYQVLGFAAQYIAYRSIFSEPGSAESEKAPAGVPSDRSDDQLVA